MNVTELLLKITGDTGSADKDLDQFGQKLRDLGSETAEPGVDVKTDSAQKAIDEVVAKLKKLDAQKAEAKAELDKRGFDSSVASVQAVLSALDHEKVNVKVDVDTKKADQAKGLFHDLDEGAKKLQISGGGVTGVFKKLVGQAALLSVLGVVTQLVASLGAGAVGLVSALAPLSGALIAYPGILGALVQGLGVAKLAFSGVGKALGGNAQAMKDLTPAAQAFVKQIQALKPELDSLKKAAQGALFSGVTQGLKSAIVNFPILRNIVAGTAGELGNLAAAAGRLVGSKAFGSNLQTIGATNITVLHNLGFAALSLISALSKVLAAAGPFLTWLSKVAQNAGAAASKAATLGQQTGVMAAFFDKTKSTLQIVGSILGNLARFLVNVGKAAAPLGQSILVSLNDKLSELAHWSGTITGQNSLKKFFEDAKPGLTAAARLIGAVASAIGSFAGGQQLAPFLDQIRTQLVPVFANLVKSTTAVFGPHLVAALVQVLKLFGNIGGSSGPLIIFVDMVGKVASVLNSLFSTMPGLQSATVDFIAFAGIFKAFKLLSFVTGFTALGKAVTAGATAFRLLAGGATLAAVAEKTSAGAAIAAKVAQLIAAGATKAWTLAQIALDAVLTANPIGIVIVAIAALIAAMILIPGAWDAVKNAVSAVFDWIKNNWPLLLAILAGPFGIAVGQIIKHFDDIKGAAQAAWSAIHGAASAAWSAIKGTIVGAASSMVNAVKSVVNGLVSAITAVWSSIHSAASSAWSSIKGTVVGAATAVVGGVRSALGAIVGVVGDIWGRVKDGVSGAWNAVTGAVRTAVSKAADAVRGAAGAFFDAGKALMQAVINGIESLANAAFDKLKNIVGKLKGLLPGSEPKDPRSPLRGLKESGKALMENFASGIPLGADKVMKNLEASLRTVPLASATSAAIQPVVVAPNITRNFHLPPGPAPVGGFDPQFAASQLDQLLRAEGVVVR